MNAIVKRGVAALLLALVLVAGVALPKGDHGLAAAGLEQRSLFQGRVDYTLTTHDREGFQGQDLENTSFAGAHVQDADFSGSNLHGAILTKGVFQGARFVAANLSNVLMDAADFRNTDLRNADLREAIATGVRWEGARIQGADFSDALLDPGAARRLCATAEGVNPETGASTRDSLAPYC
ncbi:MAG: pentapeptide repeat-containing protein [Synechococcus sp. SB0666_bin_14]|nr:pentapeptide repeat-containing protein [Synechococcus sp. SB0666_bin_14]MYA91075.1 pentapeptide repeat-containing protein [Synechococcus sp. SB0663_bin_10]MYG46133.1 pentapeptide repeat-containing protein [Synechococcus sp. SB0675_bin_6]MYJ60463.1 pentapeptide repeat-containing protein [Synechococcus sp. SB0672_bin_6]MYK91260.1 pentapeptide repeat-containing protein [Synechococcus sp. SB0669_bin_8]